MIHPMHPFYARYTWKNGVPVGIEELPAGAHTQTNTAYRIVTDPFRKRYSLEAYFQGHFEQLIYDSALLDFRQLTEEAQQLWRKEAYGEQDDKQENLIFDENDRIILKEECLFDKEGRCLETLTRSPMNQLLCKQILHYSNDGSFSGSTLLDINNQEIRSC